MDLGEERHFKTVWTRVSGIVDGDGRSVFRPAVLYPF